MNAYAHSSAYRRTQVEGASSDQILLQLVEAGVRHARQARILGEQQDLPRARENALRTLGIVSELDSSLDRETGGEIVEQLESLYAFLLREIGEANRQNEFHRFQDVEDILYTLYQGWKDAVASLKDAGQEENAAAAMGARV